MCLISKTNLLLKLGSEAASVKVNLKERCPWEITLHSPRENTFLCLSKSALNQCWDQTTLQGILWQHICSKNPGVEEQ